MKPESLFNFHTDGFGKTHVEPIELKYPEVAGYKEHTTSKETAKEELPLVKVTQVGTGTDSTEGTYSGTVRGRYESNLSFQAGGRIISHGGCS